MSRAVTKKQIALIHIAIRQLGLGDLDKLAILDIYGGVKSSRDLDQRGFDKVMTYLRDIGFKPQRGSDYGERPGMASRKQLAYLHDLWAEWTEGGGTEQSLNVWINHFFHVSHLRFLDKATARKAIGTLKGMVARLEVKNSTSDASGGTHT